MRKLTIILTLLTLLSAVLSISAQDSNDEDFMIEDAESVEQAVEMITTALEAGGAQVPLLHNHSAAAASVDLELLPTTVIFFGNPNIGTPLMVDSPTIGIDLPLKFLVWEDAEGSIHLSYNSTDYLAERHDIEDFDELFETVSGILGRFGENEIYVPSDGDADDMDDDDDESEMSEEGDDSEEMDNGLVVIPSNQSFDDTVASLLTALEEREFRVPLVLDHSAAAAGVDLELLPTTLIVFGNPNIGSPLMQNTQGIGLDLPQKFLVWEDAEGNVSIAYNSPFYLAQRHGLMGMDDVLEKVMGALDGLALAGAGE